MRKSRLLLEGTLESVGEESSVKHGISGKCRMPCYLRAQEHRNCDAGAFSVDLQIRCDLSQSKPTRYSLRYSKKLSIE